MTTVNELKAWLRGVEDMQGENWKPNKAQWDKIREKIHDLLDNEPQPQQYTPYPQQFAPSYGHLNQYHADIPPPMSSIDATAAPTYINGEHAEFF